MRIRIAPSSTMTAPRAGELARALSGLVLDVPPEVAEKLTGRGLAAPVAPPAPPRGEPVTRVLLLADLHQSGNAGCASAAAGDVIEVADELADRLVRLGIAEPAPEETDRRAAARRPFAAVHRLPRSFTGRVIA